LNKVLFASFSFKKKKNLSSLSLVFFLEQYPPGFLTWADKIAR